MYECNRIDLTSHAVDKQDTVRTMSLHCHIGLLYVAPPTKRSCCVNSMACLEQSHQLSRRSLLAGLPLAWSLTRPVESCAAEQGIKPSDFTVPALSTAEYVEKIRSVCPLNRTWSTQGKVQAGDLIVSVLVQNHEGASLETHGALSGSQQVHGSLQ